MHRGRCIAEGGFKINGPPINGKGPMTKEEDQESSNKASPPKPTQAGRIETCQETIKEARRCLENNDKQCTMRKIEEAIKANCHNGYAVGKEIADGVRELVHELWLRSNDEKRCELLRTLRGLGASKRWVMMALHKNDKALNTWFVKCGIDWENKAVRYEAVKKIEDLLRKRFGWDEVIMSNIMWRYIGVNVDELLDHGIDPNTWINALNGLSTEDSYWFGVQHGDLYIRKQKQLIRIEIATSNLIDAIYFMALMRTIATPNVAFTQNNNYLSVCYYILLKHWPWYGVEHKVISSFDMNSVLKYLAGLIDTDGSVIITYSKRYRSYIPEVRVFACKECTDFLEQIRDVVYEKLGIKGSVLTCRSSSELRYQGSQAAELLKYIRPYIRHPLKRLRAELYLMFRNRELSGKEFRHYYEQTKYGDDDDLKRNHAIDALAQAAPQTHTHGEPTHNPIKGIERKGTTVKI
jgi:hypothetical protein